MAMAGLKMTRFMNSREMVLTEIHEAMMEIQDMKQYAPPGFAKAELRRFEERLMDVYSEFSAYCADQESLMRGERP